MFHMQIICALQLELQNLIYKSETKFLIFGGKLFMDGVFLTLKLIEINWEGLTDF